MHLKIECFVQKKGGAKNEQKNKREKNFFPKKDLVQNSDTFSIPSEIGRDILDFKREETAAQRNNQKGHQTNILTPVQIIDCFSTITSMKQSTKSKTRYKAIILFAFYKHLKMETIFMNTESSRINTSNKFSIILLISLVLMSLIKILYWITEAFIRRRKILKLHITTTHLKYLLQCGMMNSIFLLVHILYLIIKVI